MIYVRVPSTTQKYIRSIKFGTGIFICRLPFAYTLAQTPAIGALAEGPVFVVGVAL